MPQALRPRSAADLVGQTIELTFRCFSKLSIIYLVYGVVISALLGGVLALFWDDCLRLMQYDPSDSTSPPPDPLVTLLFLGLMAIALILAAVPAAAAVPAVAEQFISRRMTLGQCIAVGLRKMWTVIGIQFVIGLLATPVGVIGFFALAIAAGMGSLPGILFGLALLVGGIFIAAFVFAKYYVAVPAAVVEDLPLGWSLSRGGALTVGHRWRVFFVWLIVYMFTWMISFGGTIVSSVLTSAFDKNEATETIIYVVGLAIVVVVQFLSAMLLGVSQVAVYFDLRGRVEDFDTENLEKLVEDIGAARGPAMEA